MITKSATLRFFVFIFSFYLMQCSCNKSENKVVPPTENTSILYKHTDFVMGADLSYTNAMIDNNAIYKTKGKVKNPYAIFKEAGANVVRVRLWHNPTWQTNIYGSTKYSNLEDVTKTIQEAKKNGMAINLDLHYSDDWADPSKQSIPAAWKNLNLDQLKDSVYNYTKYVLKKLEQKQLTPEYIQVGNENNGGILWPLGKINNSDFKNFVVLLNSGIKAVRDFSVNASIQPKIILHVAQLQNATWWTEGIIKAGISDFDILGISHYSKWSDMKTMVEVKSAIAGLKAKLNKDVMIVETAYPWSGTSHDNYPNIFALSDSIQGYVISKNNQLKYMKDLTQAIIDGGGKGIMYWEPSWISTSTFKDRWGTGSAWENNSFFDYSGEQLPVMNYMTHKYNFK
jgi:arabinogalactan endo-1,4-beta-galactosidase